MCFYSIWYKFYFIGSIGVPVGVKNTSDGTEKSDSLDLYLYLNEVAYVTPITLEPVTILYFLESQANNALRTSLAQHLR